MLSQELQSMKHDGGCRSISNRVSRDVIKMADEEGLVQNSKAKMAIKDGNEALASWISCMMYKPVYQNLIHLPVGENALPACHNILRHSKVHLVAK